MKQPVIIMLAIMMLMTTAACQRDNVTERIVPPATEEASSSAVGESAIVNTSGAGQEYDAAPSNTVRFYFTGARSGVEIAQLLSMRADGSGLLQHTTGGDVKYGIYECVPLQRVYFSRDEALAALLKTGKTKTLLVKEGVQYHTPRCSHDGRYLSVTAWDKEAESAHIEVYDADTVSRLQRWEGEFASWARDRNAVVYRVVVQNEKPQRVDIYIRDMEKGTPELLFSTKIGEYIYDLTEPLLLGPGPRDVVFRVYDEHEYFYYLNELGNAFIKTRDGKPLAHHDVYSGNIENSLEQGALSVSPDGTMAVLEEHPWNTPPSLYLVDMKTRDSWEIAEGFNPVWSNDSKLVLFNKDPKHYEEYHEMLKKGFAPSRVYPQSLDGYEVYMYDIQQKKEYRLTDNDLYEGFL